MIPATNNVFRYSLQKRNNSMFNNEARLFLICVKSRVVWLHRWHSYSLVAALSLKTWERTKDLNVKFSTNKFSLKEYIICVIWVSDTDFVLHWWIAISQKLFSLNFLSQPASRRRMNCIIRYQNFINFYCAAHKKNPLKNPVAVLINYINYSCMYYHLWPLLVSYQFYFLIKNASNSGVIDTRVKYLQT